MSSSFKNFILTEDEKTVLERIKNKKNPVKLSELLDYNIVCGVSRKIMVAIMEKFYVRGDEVNVTTVLANNLHCIPLDIFRYLILFVSDKKLKTYLYGNAMAIGRADLLSSIKGLDSSNYKTLLELGGPLMLHKKIRDQTGRENSQKRTIRHKKRGSLLVE